MAVHGSAGIGLRQSWPGGGNAAEFTRPSSRLMRKVPETAISTPTFSSTIVAKAVLTFQRHPSTACDRREIRLWRLSGAEVPAHATGASRTLLLCAVSKIQAAQNDAGRSALELLCVKLKSRTRFDLIAQPDKLRFALVRLRPLRLFQLVHGGCADGAWYFPFTVNHRKQHHHSVKFVTAEAAACQCHWIASR